MKQLNPSKLQKLAKLHISAVYQVMDAGSPRQNNSLSILYYNQKNVGQQASMTRGWGRYKCTSHLR